MKTKDERVRESVQILTKLRGLGIPQNDIGYLLTKQALDSWIASGEEAHHEIPFPRANRTGYLDLPSLASDIARFVLKVDKTPEDIIGE